MVSHLAILSESSQAPPQVLDVIPCGMLEGFHSLSNVTVCEMANNKSLPFPEKCLGVSFLTSFSITFVDQEVGFEQSGQHGQVRSHLYI